VCSFPPAPAEQRATVRVVRRFDAPPLRVFQVWLDPRKARAWMAALVPDAEIVRVDINPRVGRAFKIVVRESGGEILHVGEFVEVARSRRLVFTWVVPGVSKETTLVSLDIRAAWGGTELTLTHERVLPTDAARAEATWERVFDSVVTLLAW
jgi:uncharacterized protein YndB with AHSA1/START domain